MVVTRWVGLGLALLSLAGCSRTEASAPRPVRLTLESTDGVSREFPALAAKANFTVLEFYSGNCPCQTAHDAVLRQLHGRFRSRNVGFFVVDSEVGASLEADRAQALARAYSFPILIDRGAKLADTLGAEYSTYSVIVDRNGTPVYRGGIDSSHAEIRPDSEPYLSNALDDLLAGRTPRVPESKAMGCALRKW